MNRIDLTFEELKKKGEKALVGFISGGDPTPEKSIEIIRSMIEGGIDILELGVPFSDPTADGPVIQRSSQRAIKAGMNLGRIIEMVREIRSFSQVPVVIFSYYNPILAYGPVKFYEDSVKAGADGLLLVDLPPEESEELTSLWPGNDLALIKLIALTTPVERVKKITADASGFVYLVSMTGVTGSSGIDTVALKEKMSELRAITDVPVCIGFGISKPGQVREVCGISDGAVVGSAFERIVEGNVSDPNMPSMTGELAKELKEGTR